MSKRYKHWQETLLYLLHHQTCNHLVIDLLQLWCCSISVWKPSHNSRAWFHVGIFSILLLDLMKYFSTPVWFWQMYKFGYWHELLNWLFLTRIYIIAVILAIHFSLYNFVLILPFINLCWNHKTSVGILTACSLIHSDFATDLLLYS